MKKENTTPTKEGLHTQGEWKVVENSIRNFPHDPAFWHIDIVNKEATIRIVKVVGTSKEQAEANAELIVKAVNERQAVLDSHRELLTSLDYLLRNFDSHKNSANAIVMANAAINNAKNIKYDNK